MVDLYLLPEALQVLVVAEICSRHGIRPSAVVEVKRDDYVSDALPERRIELQQMSSCSVIRVLAAEEGYQKLWTYVVTCQGRVVSDSLVDIPLPWVSRWKDEAQAARRLRFL